MLDVNCKIKIKNQTQTCKKPIIQTDSFENGKYFLNGKYFGDIIFSDEKTIKVVCRNGNKYMEGQISTFHFPKGI